MEKVIVPAAEQAGQHSWELLLALSVDAATSHGPLWLRALYKSSPYYQQRTARNSILGHRWQELVFGEAIASIDSTLGISIKEAVPEKRSASCAKLGCTR